MRERINIENNNILGLGAIWFWGFIYFLFIAHWEFWRAFFWIYIAIEKIVFSK